MCPTCSISREAMTDSEIAAHAKDIINQQLLAVALALATKDRDDQIPFLANLIDATAKEAGMAIEKPSTSLALQRAHVTIFLPNALNMLPTSNECRLV